MHMCTLVHMRAHACTKPSASLLLKFINSSDNNLTSEAPNNKKSL